jgi:aspartate kinase
VREPDLRARLVAELREECQELTVFLGAAHKLGEVRVRTLDHVVGKGENLACRFTATLLQDRGIDAVFVDLAEVIDFPVKETLDQAFYDQLARTLGDAVSARGNRVPVVTGYFGQIAGGLLSKIGRGYTDLCAALIAVGLHAEELQVWKEVDGIFTANPRQVPTARLLPTITPAEAAELTYYGSEVIHPFTMEQVIRARIPIRIRSVLNLHNSGTIIFPDPATAPTSPSAFDIASPSEPSKATIIRNRSGSQLSSRAHSRAGGSRGGPNRPKRPTAVTVKNNIVVLNVHSNKRTLSHGFFAGIFSVLDRCKLSVDLISTSEVHVSMALHSESAWLSSGGSDSAAAAQQADEGEKEIVNNSLRQAVYELTQFGRVDVSDGMAILSLVGKQMRHMPGIAGKMFSVLGENDVNIEMISQGKSGQLRWSRDS